MDPLRPELAGKVALVSGAGGDIGREVVARLIHAETKICGVDINFRDLRERLGNVQDVQLLEIDIRQPEQAKRAVESTVEKFGQIDFLLNIAAVAPTIPLVELGPDDFKRVIDTNLNGMFYLSRAAIDHMIPRRYGRIVNFTSTVSVQGAPGQTAYAASKGGALALTRNFALELAPYGITVNAFMPGAVNTQMMQAYAPPAVLDQMRATGALREPTQLPDALLFLLTDAASEITGHEILMGTSPAVLQATAARA